MTLWAPIIFMLLGVGLLVWARPLARAQYEYYRDAAWWYPKPRSDSPFWYQFGGIAFILFSVLSLLGLLVS